MSREEQAKYISEKLMEDPEFKKAFVGAITDAVNEVVKAIKALQQEPCTDAISRQAVLMQLDKYLCGVPFEEKGIDKVIKELPPVKPTEKVGQWIKIDDCSNSGYYCSECRKRVVKEGWSDTVKIIKYCPNCGSRMMQGVEE